MTTERQLGKWCRFHFETGTISIPSIFITNTGNLRSLFKEKDEYEMKDVDVSTGRVFADYIMSRRYDVDYETVARDERMALREYMIALKAWAMGRRYNLYGLVVLAREHVIDLAELVNPIWVLEVTVDTPLAMKHITGIIHRIDDFTWDVLETTTKRQATDILLHMQPPDTVGRLWVMLQFMQKAQGPALQRGQRLLRQELMRAREGINPEDDTPFEEDVDEYDEIPFDHFIPGAKIKCGKIMRAMVGSIKSSQNIGTRNKEKPSKRDKYIFTVRSISSDHL
ncbi:hypothetical protein BFJ66_g7764 [Fusarium oxysporum f. sp. cepae]|uniref:BTB domain-containing protein n=1 Tax=Fusarium oxysporum f. sp. cepae TaxID=396571 RepID=A0A3L6N782_FUSOX|nr:hypothetical protein BFJ65_g12160 [Fusarium oxysporum f. sp. cepae]RKK48085.1 hypothetical protein BFJ66_g7764 [Fusarium oxysporum f. sp. cepae]